MSTFGQNYSHQNLSYMHTTAHTASHQFLGIPEKRSSQKNHSNLDFFVAKNCHSNHFSSYRNNFRNPTINHSIALV